MSHPPQDSTGRPITEGDRVRWRGEIYTIKAFGELAGNGSRTLTFEEPLHLQDEVPNETAVDCVEHEAFACSDCGENGFGYHVCPRSTEVE